MFKKLSIIGFILFTSFACTSNNKTKIVTASHSLGGGLTQQAAYSSDKIDFAYAFDPSVVTGYFSVDADKREKNSEGVTIFRIYEKGEILSTLRGFMRKLSPLTEKNPYLVEIGDNFSHDNAIAEHSGMWAV